MQLRAILWQGESTDHRQPKQVAGSLLALNTKHHQLSHANPLQITARTVCTCFKVVQPGHLKTSKSILQGGAPNPGTPFNIPTPTRLKWAVHLPQNGIPWVLTHSESRRPGAHHLPPHVAVRRAVRRAVVRRRVVVVRRGARRREAHGAGAGHVERLEGARAVGLEGHEDPGGPSSCQLVLPFSFLFVFCFLF